MDRKPFAHLAQKYFENHPASSAHTLEDLEESQAAEVLKALPERLATEIMRHLNEGYAARLISYLPPALLQSIVERLDAQKGAQMFLRLPEETRASFLLNLSEQKKRQIHDYLTYPEDSAGRIMSTRFISFHEDTLIKDAIQKIRVAAQKGETASYVYVTDHGHRLAGVLNMRDMMLAPGQASLASVMRKEIFTVNCFMDREKVANELSARRFFAVPVVDAENHLLGVVRAEELINDVKEEAAEDIQKMFGAGGDERAFSPVGFTLRKRLPWLYVNLATAFLAAAVVAVFEDLIAKITVLAVFLPIVAGQGGNAGAQSLAVVMRGIVMREIAPGHRMRLVLKETLVGFVNGLVIGLVTALIAWLWQANPYLGLVIGLGMLVNLTLAGLAGAGIPLLMKSAGLDPAQCSNIILTTITDVFGFLSFLGFAVLFRHFLM